MSFLTAKYINCADDEFAINWNKLHIIISMLFIYVNIRSKTRLISSDYLFYCLFQNGQLEKEFPLCH